MNQLVNYKKTKKTYNGLQVVELLMDREVFLDLPLACIKFDVEYKNPVIFGSIKGVSTIYEADDVIKHINDTTKEFNLTVLEGGKLKECEVNEEAQLTIRLPKDTNLSELVWDGKQIIRNSIIQDGDE